MCKYFVTFASKYTQWPIGRDRRVRHYEQEARHAADIAEKYGFVSRIWTEDTMKAIGIDKRHDFMLGYRFKPIAIWKTLQDVDYDDFVLWTDSNHILIADPQPILDVAQTHGIFCHDHWTSGGPKIYPGIEWTKRDAFVIMDCDEVRYWQAPQIQVNVIAFCKTPMVLEFCSQWLTYCCDKRIMTLDPTNVLGLPNSPDYHEHRCEQSIFSILQVKYGIPAQADPLNIVKELEV